MLKLTKGNYVAEVKEQIVGGGDLQQMIVLADGKVIVLSFGIIGIYENEDAYESADDDGRLWSGLILE